ncbi:MAG: class I SAM-dependent methyltransferase [Chitinophagaceae bacterium]|nr:class I SAM-dependent methyltransferase [Chitinophagaceae bacterium]
MMKCSFRFLIFLFPAMLGACGDNQAQKNIRKEQEKVYEYTTASRDGIGKFYHGREIAHMMGAAGMEWLNRPERNAEENTELAIGKIEIAPTGVIADIGAGSGYYSFRLAKKVPKGKIYAVEVQDEMIAALAREKASKNDSVVEVVKGTEKSPKLPANTLDLVLMVDVYHELEYPHEMMQSIKKCLKPDGKVLFIEYRGEDPSIPIKALHKMTVAQLNKEMEANGFSLYYKGDFLPIQHFLLYERTKKASDK